MPQTAADVLKYKAGLERRIQFQAMGILKGPQRDTMLQNREQYQLKSQMTKRNYDQQMNSLHAQRRDELQTRNIQCRQVLGKLQESLDMKQVQKFQRCCSASANTHKELEQMASVLQAAKQERRDHYNQQLQQMKVKKNELYCKKISGRLAEQLEHMKQFEQQEKTAKEERDRLQNMEQQLDFLKKMRVRTWY